MAKRITGCDWAYETIEGMDLWLRETLKYPDDDLSAPGSSFAPRSQSPTEDGFDHLSPRAYGTYSAILADRDDFLRAAQATRSAPRPKIVVVDEAWENSKLMPDKAVFLTAACSEINEMRVSPWADDEDKDPKDYWNPYLKHRIGNMYDPDEDKFRQFDDIRAIDHGVACVAALRVSEQHPAYLKMIRGYRADPDNPNDPSVKEANLWNLSSRADIILVPRRGHAPLAKDPFENALKVACRVNVITQAEFEAFNTDDTRDLINEASKADKSKTIELLIQHMFEITYDGFDQREHKPETEGKEPQYRYEGTPFIKAVLAQHLRQGSAGSPFDTMMYMMRKLVIATNLALEEAGLAETLKLLRKAARAKKIGRGDTVVIPWELNLWDEKDGDQLHEDLNHFGGRNLKSRDFHLERGPKVDAPNDEPWLSDDRPDLDEIAKIDLPVIAYRAVENEVQKLTCRHRVSVIISGGNSYIDLGQICIQKLDMLLPTKRFDDSLSEQAREEAVRRESRRLFQSRGTYCGAIIVGSGIPSLSKYWMDPLHQQKGFNKGARRKNIHDHKEALWAAARSNRGMRDYRQRFANYGLVVSAFGRGSATEVFNYDDRVVSFPVYYHWGGASIASMVAAACLANVQQIRILSDFIDYVRSDSGKDRKLLRPLKPFEARAHFEQWRSNDSFKYDCLEDLMGAPPDIRSWFEGSCYFDSLTEFTEKGSAWIEELSNAHSDYTPD